MVSPCTTTWLMRGPVSKRWMVMLFSEVQGLLRAYAAACRVVCLSGPRLRRRASRIPARKQAAAEKRAFQRAVAVHAAAAETGGFAGGVEAGDDLAVVAEHAGVEVGLEAAERLAGEDVELDRDQRAMGGVENAVRPGGADQFVADIFSCVVD